MNFAVAGLMVSTPALVHGFLSGSLAGVGGTALQSMAGGLGAMLAGAPLALGRKGLKLAQKQVVAPMARKLIANPARNLANRLRPTKNAAQKGPPQKTVQNQKKETRN